MEKEMTVTEFTDSLNRLNALLKMWQADYIFNMLCAEFPDYMRSIVRPVSDRAWYKLTFDSVNYWK